jgi:hypothetical protein
VPVNVHWDPAYTTAEVDFVMSVSATDGLELVAEKEELPAMAARSTATRGTKRAKKEAYGKRSGPRTSKKK